MKIAILQSNYIPWKGYFDIINLVDEFIVYDECQYSKGTWRNRNKIKTPAGLKWLSIPVNFKFREKTHIKDVTVRDHTWVQKHIEAFKMNYAKAPYFEELMPFFESLYDQCRYAYRLSEINYIFIKSITEKLGFDTDITFSNQYNIISTNPTERLIELCSKAGGTVYLSGPAAKNYLEQEKFKDNGIELRWMDYTSYLPYPQINGVFQHNVTVIDLLLNIGTAGIKKYMLSCGNEFRNRIFKCAN